MRRIQNQRQAEMIAAGLDLYPPEIRHRLDGVDVFFGDPHFAGLHRDVREGKRIDGSPFTLLEAAHFVSPHPHPWFAGVDRPTVIVPYRSRITPWDVVHEFAHALDHLLGRPSVRLRIAPITTYAGTNEHEAFAEAVSAWLVPHRLWARDGWRSWICHYAPQFPAFLDAVASPERGFRGP